MARFYGRFHSPHTGCIGDQHLTSPCRSRRTHKRTIRLPPDHCEVVTVHEEIGGIAGPRRCEVNRDPLVILKHCYVSGVTQHVRHSTEPKLICKVPPEL
jgi:hypothetical protein